MYEVRVGLEVYGEWDSYRRWKVAYRVFGVWMPEQYPEVLSVEWYDDSAVNLDRIFRFESEEMYHWFLLRQ